MERNGVEQARFAYDPLGRRLEKVAGGVITTYTYDGAGILRELRGATTLRYVHGPGVDEPLAAEDRATVSFLHADGLGSVVRATNAGGGVTLTRQYDSWGNLEAGGSEPGYAFTGREWDPETGLYYYRARYYDPKIGRFISEDPIGLGGGLNFYGYVDSTPTNSVDPSGLASATVRKPRVVFVDPPRWACWNSEWGCVEPWDEYSAECTRCGTLRITITMAPEVSVRKGKKYDFGPWGFGRPRDKSVVGQKSAIAHEMRHVDDYRQDMTAYSETWEKDYGSWEECEKFRQYFLDSLPLIRSTFRRKSQSARD